MLAKLRRKRPRASSKVAVASSGEETKEGGPGPHSSAGSGHSIQRLRRMLARASGGYSPSADARLLQRDAAQLEACRDPEAAIVQLLQRVDNHPRASSPVEWASTQSKLGAAFLQRREGVRRENLELAVQHLKAALEVFTRADYPDDFGSVEHLLGNAYADRVNGRRKDNLEEALAHYSSALDVRDASHSPPELFASTLSNSAIVLMHRIEGERGANVELALQRYKAALGVYNKTTFPARWVSMQGNIGNCYMHRQRGQRAHNVQNAIDHYNCALMLYTLKDFPQDWARTKVCVGSAHMALMDAERSMHVEEAIACFQAALQVIHREPEALHWATVQVELGKAYAARVEGSRRENADEAIRYATAATDVYTSLAMAGEVGQSHVLLAHFYLARVTDSLADNQEKAITHLRTALEAFDSQGLYKDAADARVELGELYMARVTDGWLQNLDTAMEFLGAASGVLKRGQFPLDWAKTQRKMASALRRRVVGSQEATVEVAIPTLTRALEVLTVEAEPAEFATVQHELALCYSLRLQGERAQNLEQGIGHARLALQVRTPDGDPVAHAESAGLAARLLMLSNALQEAAVMAESGLSACRDVRLFCTRGQTELHEQAQWFAELYDVAIAVSLRLHSQQPQQALELVEKAKAGELRDLLQWQTSTPRDVSVAVLGGLQRRRGALCAQQQLLDAAAEGASWRALREAYVALDLFVEQEIAPRDPIFSTFQHFPDFDYDSIAATTNTTDAMGVHFHVGQHEVMVWCVIPGQPEPVFHRLCDEAQLFELRKAVTGLHAHIDEAQEAGRSPALLQRLQKIAALLQVNAWCGLNAIPQSVTGLVVFPHGFLDRIPFTALPLGFAGRVMMDRFSAGIRVVPSVQLLRLVQARPAAAAQRKPSVFAVCGPNHIEAEVEAVGQMGATTALRAAASTRAAVLDAKQLRAASTVLFSGSASIRPDYPEGSTIDLQGGESLSLRDLFDRIRLPACRVAVLPTPVSGGPSTAGILPTGALVAGAGCAVNTLWAVDAESKLSLLSKFAARAAKGVAPAVAMQEGQAALRALDPFHWAALQVVG